MPDVWLIEKLKMKMGLTTARGVEVWTNTTKGPPRRGSPLMEEHPA
jgi:hypothetical protein